MILRELSEQEGRDILGEVMVWCNKEGLMDCEVEQISVDSRDWAKYETSMFTKSGRETFVLGEAFQDENWKLQFELDKKDHARLTDGGFEEYRSNPDRFVPVVVLEDGATGRRFLLDGQHRVARSYERFLQVGSSINHPVVLITCPDGSDYLYNWGWA